MILPSYSWAYIWTKLLQKPQEMWVLSLGQEDPLEEGMATHSSIFAWRIPQTEKPGRLQSMGSQRVWQNWSDLTRMHIMWCRVRLLKLGTWYLGTYKATRQKFHIFLEDRLYWKAEGKHCYDKFEKQLQNKNAPQCFYCSKNTKCKMNHPNHF